MAFRTCAASALMLPSSCPPYLTAIGFGPFFGSDAAQPEPDVVRMMLAMPFPRLPLVVCGVLKIVYDGALLYSFRHVKSPEEA